jgi:hypothetical protein
LLHSRTDRQNSRNIIARIGQRGQDSWTRQLTRTVRRQPWEEDKRRQNGENMKRQDSWGTGQQKQNNFSRTAMIEQPGHDSWDWIAWQDRTTRI